MSPRTENIITIDWRHAFRIVLISITYFRIQKMWPDGFVRARDWMGNILPVEQRLTSHRRVRFLYALVSSMIPRLPDRSCRFLKLILFINIFNTIIQVSYI